MHHVPPPVRVSQIVVCACYSHRVVPATAAQHMTFTCMVIPLSSCHHVMCPYLGLRYSFIQQIILDGRSPPHPPARTLLLMCLHVHVCRTA